eukprot:6177897-Pleurochrysis_carterae.AAC.1
MSGTRTRASAATSHAYCASWLLGASACEQNANECSQVHMPLPSLTPERQGRARGRRSGRSLRRQPPFDGQTTPLCARRTPLPTTAVHASASTSL